jgi:hypothetical protein
MRFFVLLVLSVMMAAAAQKPAAVPAGAVKSADGSFRFTDGHGRKWIYRATPFGVARVQDVGAVVDPAELEKSIADVKAFDLGDRVRFERPGPFGTYRWERSKTELSPTERAAWERGQGLK